MRPGAHYGTDGGEEAERRSHHSRIRANAGGSQRQPKRVRAGGAAYGLGHAELLGGGPLELSHRSAQDELLAIEYVSQRSQDFFANGSVLARQVKHWNGSGESSRTSF